MSLVSQNVKMSLKILTEDTVGEAIWEILFFVHKCQYWYVLQSTIKSFCRLMQIMCFICSSKNAQSETPFINDIRTAPNLLSPSSSTTTLAPFQKIEGYHGISVFRKLVWLLVNNYFCHGFCIILRVEEAYYLSIIHNCN